MSQSKIKFNIEGEVLKNVMDYRDVVSGSLSDPIDIVIPEGVEIIAAYALWNIQIKSLSLPSTLLHIRKAAFLRSGLSDVVIPEGVISIEDQAFANCGIRTLKLPASLSSIGYECFEDNSLDKVEIPEKISDVGESAFSRCSLKEIRIPRGIPCLKASAFVDNPGSKMYIGGKETFTIQRFYSVYQIDDGVLKLLGGRRARSDFNKVLDMVFETPLDQLLGLDLRSWKEDKKLLEDIVNARLKGLV